jgi:predicted ATPase
MIQEPFIQKLTLRNFRSIRNETVTFANPLFLVGRNGSGKSNFVRALAFLADCMTLPLQAAFSKNGNLWNSHGSSSFYTPTIEIRLDFQQKGSFSYRGHYHLSIEASTLGSPEVVMEQCFVFSEYAGNPWFSRTKTHFQSSVPGINPIVNPHSLSLPIVAGAAGFSPLLNALSTMRVYTINPTALSQVQEGTGNTYLAGNGSNSASVLLNLARQDVGAIERVRQLLSSIVPGVTRIEPILANNKLFLMIAQAGEGTDGTLFNADAMSDGTLSALGLIIAAIQDPMPSLIAIEEPERNIHPGALEAIGDIINIAAQRTQVVVTTHSPDLLDAKWLQPENLRVVEWEKGATRISELGDAPIKALQRHLMGAGELLRANALDAAAPKLEDNSDLFQETSV